eukprot:356539-Chlamydomonas_euryale.AAC.6
MTGPLMADAFIKGQVWITGRPYAKWSHTLLALVAGVVQANCNKHYQQQILTAPTTSTTTSSGPAWKLLHWEIRCGCFFQQCVRIQGCTLGTAKVFHKHATQQQQTTPTAASWHVCEGSMLPLLIYANIYPSARSQICLWNILLLRSEELRCRRGYAWHQSHAYNKGAIKALTSKLRPGHPPPPILWPSPPLPPLHTQMILRPPLDALRLH